jgi:hypothetical protein
MRPLWSEFVQEVRAVLTKIARKKEVDVLNPVHQVPHTEIPTIVRDTERAESMLANRDFALYVDGRRVRCDSIEVIPGADGISVAVNFETSLGAVMDPAVEPAIEKMWGGWKAGDTVHLRQPPPAPGKAYPSSGIATIIDIRPPTREGEAVYFRVQAMTPIYDYRRDKQICGAQEEYLIPVSWFPPR